MHYPGMTSSIFKAAAFQEVAAPKSCMVLYISAVTEKGVKCNVFFKMQYV